MKKYYIVVGLIITNFLTPSFVHADSDFMSAWKRWILTRRVVSSEATIQSVEKQKSLKQGYSNRYRRGLTVSREAKLRVQVSAIRPNQAIYKITSEAIKIFEVGVKLDVEKNSTKYQEPVVLGDAKFKLFKNNGIAADVRGFSLSINGEEFSFQKDGTIIVPLNNIRLSRGKSFGFDVKIRVKDPSITPHVPGELFLRMEELTAYGETSKKKMIGYKYGSLVSQKLLFDPIPYVNTGYNSDIVLGESATIYSRALEEGEEALVLVGRFAANYDDLYVREAIVRNILTGSNVDALIEEVRAVNLNTGLVLDTAMFTGGQANLRFHPDVFVGRGDQVKIGFYVKISDPLNRTALDSRFKLELAPEDLVVQSVTTGRDLETGAKHFAINSEEFTIAQGRMVVAPSHQQHSFAVGTSRPETVFRFTIGGGDSKIGRISFDAYPSGLEFMDGSLSNNDIELVRIMGNQEHDQSVIVNASGNNITLDFSSPFSKSKDEIVEFGLKMALDNITGNDISDSVAVRISSDSSYQHGTLSGLKASGANFIWSDRSARGHSIATNDWFSGYLVSGLPSNTAVVKRFEN